MTTGNGDAPVIKNAHSDIDSTNKTLLKSDALYKVEIFADPDSPRHEAFRLDLSLLMCVSSPVNFAVCAGHDGAAAGAGVHARAAPHHGQAQVGVHAVVGGRGAAAGDAAEDGRSEEDDRGRGVHGVLAACDGAGAAGGREGGGDRPGQGELRGGAAVHREGRGGAQGGLPRGEGAGEAGRAARRGGGGGAGGGVRFRLRGRRQAQLREVPRAAAAAGARRRPHHLRQHAVGRHGGAAAGHPALRPGPPVLRRHQGPQLQARRRPAHRHLPALHGRRHHHLPPPRVTGRPASQSTLFRPSTQSIPRVINQRVCCIPFSTHHHYYTRLLLILNCRLNFSSLFLFK